MAFDFTSAPGPVPSFNERAMQYLVNTIQPRFTYALQPHVLHVADGLMPTQIDARKMSGLQGHPVTLRMIYNHLDTDEQAVADLVQRSREAQKTRAGFDIH